MQTTLLTLLDIPLIRGVSSHIGMVYKTPYIEIFFTNDGFQDDTSTRRLSIEFTHRMDMQFFLQQCHKLKDELGNYTHVPNKSWAVTFSTFMYIKLVKNIKPNLDLFHKTRPLPLKN